MTSVRDQLSRNLQNINHEIRCACLRSGRDPSAVQLIAVTKYANWAWVEELSFLHQTFGENRPQQLAERQKMLPAVQWHLIGQLQRNKVRMALQHSVLIHSVDSLRLLEKIEESARSINVNTRVLLQVNTSGEASKSGFTPVELAEVWPSIQRICSRTHVIGLMTMAAESEDPENARPAFRKLRLLRDQLVDRKDSQTAQISLPELSMGMSGDFITAVEEGATFVRVGSKIFAGLASP